MKDADKRLSLGRQFHASDVSTLATNTLNARVPIYVSHVISPQGMPAPTLPPPVEAAYAIHVHHRAVDRVDTWIDGKHAETVPVRPGGAVIFDLQAKPVAHVHGAFGFTRFHVKRAALEQLADDQGLKFCGRLDTPPFGTPDPIIEHLALALIHRAKIYGEETDSLFSDWVALAFHAHLLSTYGSVPSRRSVAGALPQRRVQSITDWMSERLDQSLSIAQIAGEAQMSASAFARAFKRSTGETPHRWLMKSRIRKARSLLHLTTLPIADIALQCGFVDQSHLTRAFVRLIGTSPAVWRKQHSK